MVAKKLSEVRELARTYRAVYGDAAYHKALRGLSNEEYHVLWMFLEGEPPEDMVEYLARSLTDGLGRLLTEEDLRRGETAFVNIAFKLRRALDI